MQWQNVADYAQMSEKGAEHIYQEIASATRKGERFNLGLATGNTMIELYSLLAEKLNRDQIPLNQLHTYNLDEYIDNNGNSVQKTNALSYHKYMWKNLFCRLNSELGFQPTQIHFPDPVDPLRFDSELEAVGGLDLQLLGIGFNGHIAFNEPEDEKSVSVSEFAARPSRIVVLSSQTLETNAQLTAGGKLDDVPQRAVTMGMKPILAAHKILLLACFKEQQFPLQLMRNGRPTPALPASYLLDHPNTIIIYTADKITLE